VGRAIAAASAVPARGTVAVVLVGEGEGVDVGLGLTTASVADWEGAAELGSSDGDADCVT
jgi:hypothetical protein